MSPNSRAANSLCHQDDSVGVQNVCRQTVRGGDWYKYHRCHVVLGGANTDMYATYVGMHVPACVHMLYVCRKPMYVRTYVPQSNVCAWA